MQTFLPYANFEKSAQCLDYKRLGKQRVEAWQIYNALKKGEYKECLECNGFGYISDKENLINDYYYSSKQCYKCKGKCKVKTAWYNHPITQMWKGYEQALLHYGLEICREWIKRGYKDTMEERFLKELVKRGIKPLIYPHWLGNKKFHISHKSNLLRKDKKYYSKFNWKVKDNLPYYWITK